MKHFVLMAIACAFSAATTAAPASMAVASGSTDLSSFQQSLKTINAVFKVFDDESSDRAYFRQEKVARLYARSMENLPLIKATITDAKVDEEDQLLAVRLAQCLPLPEYLELVKFGQRNLEAGHLRANVLGTLIVPGSEWGTLLSKGYKRPEVRSVLDGVRRSRAATSEIRDAVNDILDGTDASYIEAYGSDVRFPQLPCVVKKAP